MIGDRLLPSGWTIVLRRERRSTEANISYLDQEPCHCEIHISSQQKGLPPYQWFNPIESLMKMLAVHVLGRRYGCGDVVPLDAVSSRENMCLRMSRSDNNDKLENLTLPDQPLCIMREEEERHHGLGGLCYDSATNATPRQAFLIKPHSSFDLWTIGYDVIYNISLVIDYDQRSSRTRSTPPLGTNVWRTYNGYHGDDTFFNITMEECPLSNCYIEKEGYEAHPIIVNIAIVFIGCAFVGGAAIAWTLGHWLISVSCLMLVTSTCEILWNCCSMLFWLFFGCSGNLPWLERLIFS